MFEASVTVMTESYAHKLQGNRTQAILYLNPGQLTLDGLKSEALDAFGLFDISHGDDDSTSMVDSGATPAVATAPTPTRTTEEWKHDLMGVFSLSVRQSQEEGSLPAFYRL